MFSWLDKSVRICMLIAKSSFRYWEKYEILSMYATPLFPAIESLIELYERLNKLSISILKVPI